MTHIQRTYLQPDPIGGSAFSWLSQLALLLLTVGVLGYLSIPMMQLSSTDGLGARYGVWGFSDHLSTWWRISDMTRMQKVTAELAYVLVAWAILGWASLQFMAHRPGAKSAVFMAAAMSGLAAAVTQAFAISASIWASSACVLFVLGGLLFVLERQNLAVAQTSQGRARFTPSLRITWVWTGWLFLSSIGVLWLLDVSARGPGKLMFTGLRQLDALWLAGMVVLPAMMWLNPRAMKLLLTLRQAWHTPRGPWILCSLLVILMCIAVWLGRYAQFGAQKGYPHITAEVVRLLTGLSFAWIFSRYAEWEVALPQRVQSVGMLAAFLGVATVTLLLIGDLGPVLAIAVALLPMVFMSAISPKSGRPFLISLVSVSLAWVVALGLMRYALVEWLPGQSWVPQRLMDRLEAMNSPFSAHLDYASQMRWLLDAAGPNGYGLGAVPWCGAAPHIQQSTCTPFSGVPAQIGSDYVFNATAATFGQWAAIGLVAMTALYIVAVGISGTRTGTTATGAKRSLHMLHRWICAVFAALALGQLIVSVAGNTFFIPLSGVTQPLLGLGTASLISLAAWIGFAMGGPKSEVPLATKRSGAASDRLWIGRYAASLAIGVLVLACGLIAWSAKDNLKVEDRLVSQRLRDGLSVLACSMSGAHQRAHCALVPTTSAETARAPETEKCKALRAKATAEVTRWQLANGIADAPIALTCELAEATLLATRWVAARPKAVVMRLLGSSPTRLQTQLAIGNPYRLEGCVHLDEGEATPFAVVEKDRVRCPRGYTDMSQVLPHAQVLGQAINTHISKVRAGESNQESLNMPHLLVDPVYQQLSALQAPAWAQFFGLPTLLAMQFGDVVPRATALGTGQDVQLSIKAATQREVQFISDCYTGADCAEPMMRTVAGLHMLESARARMVGALVVDANSGAIEAATSAYSPCYQAQHSGVKKPHCIELPDPPKARDWMLTNRALRAVAMTASLDKIPMALELIRSQSPLTRNDSNLETALSRSETEKFLDDVLCAHQEFAAPCIRNHLEGLIDAGHTLGWSSYCAPEQPNCGYINLLNTKTGPHYGVPAARWMTDPSNQERSLVNRFTPGTTQFSVEKTAACYAGKSPKRWRQCKGEGLVATVAELFGQGNATSTPVGIATGMLNLVQLSQFGSVAELKQPRLLSRVDSDGSKVNHLAKPGDQKAARRILSALTQTVQPGGTAHLACLRAQGGVKQANSIQAGIPSLADLQGAAIDCGQGGEGSQWVIASKTGTPLFPHDKYTYQARLEHCRAVSAMPAGSAKDYEWQRCLVAPSKWFAAVLGRKQGDSVDWQKIIIVLAERNWDARSGMVDTPFDRGGNVAAEVGISVAQALVSENH